MTRRSARRCVAGIAALVGTLTTAACTSSARPVAASRPPAVAPTTESTLPSITLPATAPAPPSATRTTTKARTSTPAPPPTSKPAVTSGSRTTFTPPPSPPPTPRVPQTTCRSIEVRVIRGSATLGQEIAALQFVNSGSTPCTLAGYPNAMLLRKGKQIGQPAQPSSTRQSIRRLGPGDVAQSTLHDYSSCNAPLSDNVRVTVPGTSQTAVRPAQLRGCILRVDRLGPPD